MIKWVEIEIILDYRPKIWENAQYYNGVLRNKMDFRGGRGVFTICETFWGQNHT